MTHDPSRHGNSSSRRSLRRPPSHIFLSAGQTELCCGRACLDVLPQGLAPGAVDNGSGASAARPSNATLKSCAFPDSETYLPDTSLLSAGSETYLASISVSFVSKPWAGFVSES